MSRPGRRRRDRVRAATRRHIRALPRSCCLAAFLRFNGRDWDQGQYLHPDERFMTMVATDIDWPVSIARVLRQRELAAQSLQLQDDEGNTRYGSFIYGTFPLFLGKAAADLSGNDVYGAFHLSSRGLSAHVRPADGAADFPRRAAAVRAVRRVARRAVAVAVGPGHPTGALRDVRYLRLDALSRAPSTSPLKSDDNGRWWAYALAGTMAGLAIASKLSALPVIAMLGLAAGRGDPAGWVVGGDPETGAAAHCRRCSAWRWR